MKNVEYVSRPSVTNMSADTMWIYFIRARCDTIVQPRGE